MDDGQCLQNETSIDDRNFSHVFLCCCLHKETWRCIQTYNTLSSRSSYKVRWV